MDGLPQANEAPPPGPPPGPPLLNDDTVVLPELFGFTVGCCCCDCCCDCVCCCCC
ncbi:hypothetical protein ACFW04_007835 [Cataglyphis niger]